MPGDRIGSGACEKSIEIIGVIDGAAGVGEAGDIEIVVVGLIAERLIEGSAVSLRGNQGSVVAVGDGFPTLGDGPDFGPAKVGEVDISLRGYDLLKAAVDVDVFDRLLRGEKDLL